VDGSHQHTWPLSAEEWDALGECRECGLSLLRQFINIADWVVRRVENIGFVDDRTVRRRVSVDYTVPPDGVLLRGHDGPDVRVLPLALMHRKSIVSFDFRDHEDRPLPLLGLRENQALTRAVIRAWTAVLLEAKGTMCRPDLPKELDKLIEEVIAGDQSQLTKAYNRLRAGEPEGASLDGDAKFFAVLDRLAGNFVLFGTESAPPGSRRIIKWAYDEPLTLLHRTTAYRGYEQAAEPGGDPTPPSYGKSGGLPQRWHAPDPLLAGLGIQPTLIRFPTPGAELAASFHVEVTAPPEVSIVSASLLAGLPNLRYNAADPEDDLARWRAWHKKHDEAGGRRRDRLHRRPSFDSVAGGYATVDLHVSEVPYGSLSRAQVELQASPSGWLSTAWLGALLGTLVLFAAFAGKQPEDGRPDLPALVLITYAVAMVAIVVRPDPHVMATRLLSSLRMLAGFSVILTLAGALAFAFLGVDDARTPLGVLAVLSLLPSAVLTWVWALARRRMARERMRREKKPRRDDERKGTTAEKAPQRVDAASWTAVIRRLRAEYAGDPKIRLSPWEQHLPGQEVAFDHRVDLTFRTNLADVLEKAPYPYDEAVARLGFDRPAVKVASAESDRAEFMWTAEFKREVDELLGRRPIAPPRDGSTRFGRAGDLAER
jgi:hypothetical protein